MRLSVAISPFFALYFLFFAAQHAGGAIKKTRHFILPVIFGLISVASPFVVHDASASIEGITVQDGPLYYLVLGLVIIYVLAAVFYIIRENRSKHLVNPSRKQANRILILGVLQALVIVSIATIFLSEELLAQVMIPFALFLMVAIFSYAIVRHRLFDIRLVAVRALAYSFSLVTIALTYSLLVFGLLNTLLGERTSLLQQTIYLIIALMLSLTFTPLKSFFDRATRKIFYQDSYESQKVIDDFSSLLVSTVDINDLGRLSADILKNAIKPQYVGILLPSTDKDSKKKGRVMLHGSHDITKEWSLYESLSQRPEKIIVQDDLYQEDKDVHKMMQTSNAAIAARLETHDGTIGYIIFGTKSNGRPYTRQDIELIHITTDELALGIQNALRFEQIRSFNHTLQEKVDEATVKLRRTNAELRRLDEAKDEFVSMASHQLRTPLTSVKGYISMVLEGDAGKITAMQRKLLGEAFTSSERMVHLIGDFLNVSRLQTGKFMLEQRQIDLSKIAKQEVDSLQTTAGAHGLTLEFHAPSYFPLLYVDEGKIRQVLMNFIDNAIYYSEEGTAIVVKLVIDGGYAIVQVHDTGIGVPKNEQAHLFTKFFRATNARKQRPDGTGVGLFLAKKVIVAHGGTMLFESVEGEGSTFGFRLPIKKLSTAPGDNANELKK
jgi:signal transduction histidine kinase/uncharacterized membrane protein YuzA (DUF378 family)